MNTKLFALLIASIVATAIIAPMAIGQPPSTEATVTNLPPTVCCKAEFMDEFYENEIPSALTPTPPNSIPLYLLACVCDPNNDPNNNDIDKVMALVSPSLTLSDDEMGTQFAKETGPASVTITDVSGTQDGVQFDFTGLMNAQGTVVGDNFPVSQKAGGAPEIYGYGDFSKYEQYSLTFHNPGEEGVSVNLKMNTGWTEGPGGAPERDTFWQNGWTWVGPGETVTVTLDFSSATVYNAYDDPEYTQYPDGTSGVAVWRLNEVSDIGFQVCGASDNQDATLIVSAAAKVVILQRNSAFDALCQQRCVCPPDPTIPCLAYTGMFDMEPCDPAGHWTVSVIAYDGVEWSYPELNQFQYECLEALDLDFGKVSFSGAPGDVDTDGKFDGNDEGTITSVGNNPIDVYVSGTDLDGSGGAKITIDNMEADVDGLGMQTVSGAPVCFDTNLKCLETTSIEAQLDIPSGQPAGTYTGTITISPTTA